MGRTCTRRFEWDAAHRVMRHESKCKNLHGHRYVAEVTTSAVSLDPLGRVIDFGVVKRILGTWIDEMLDHGTMIHVMDTGIAKLCEANQWKFFTMSVNPTAENIAEMIFRIGSELLAPQGVQVDRVRVYETPNCYAEFP